MILLLKLLGAAGLLLTVMPSVLVMFGSMTLETHKSLMTVGMFAWFVSALAVGRLRSKAKRASVES